MTAVASLLLAVACGLDEEGSSPNDADSGAFGGASGGSGSGWNGGSAGKGGASGVDAGGSAGGAGAAGSAGVGGAAGAGGAAGSAGVGGVAGSAGGTPIPTCNELYGQVLVLIQVCPTTTPGQCKLAIDTDPDDGNPGDTCAAVCASKGAQCLAMYDNVDDVCTEDLGDERTCYDDSASEAVCFCTHPT
jgi:hypothetical protein